MSQLPYQLCVLDLDDTLLDQHHQIPARNLQALHSIMNLGVTVVLASGRMHVTMLPYVNQIGLDSPIISYNGAMVKSAAGDLWQHFKVSANLSSEILDYCFKENLQLNFYYDDTLFTRAYTDHLKLYQSRTNAPIVVEPNLSEKFAGVEPTKLVIVDTIAYTDSLLKPFKEKYANRLYVTKSSNEYLEFMPLNATKGKALQLIAERLGFTREQTIAFGDNDNDIPMIEWAGMGVAMKNARPGLLKVADAVAESNEDCGVALKLEEIYHL